MTVDVLPPPMFHKKVNPDPVVELLVDEAAENETVSGGRHDAGGEGLVVITGLGGKEVLM